MGLAYCPIDQDDWGPRPPVYKKDLPPIQKPVMDNTECNYIVMFFVAGVFLMGIVDSLRK
jgi:hypothetical protein